jgi:hypothetical protein
VDVSCKEVAVGCKVPSTLTGDEVGGCFSNGDDFCGAAVMAKVSAPPSPSIIDLSENTKI